MYKFGKRSKERLSGAHVDFQKVAYRALELSSVDFGFSEVLRDIETQKEYVRTGRSTTLNSRHLPDSSGKCYAGDVYAFVDGEASYQEKHLKAVAKAFFRAAVELGVQIEWGGHWSSFVDMPHFQLSAREYPKK